MALDLGAIYGTLELDQSPFTGGLQSALGKVRTWGTTGKRLAATAGLGIGLAVVGSVAKAMDLQPARNKLRAQLDLSAKDSAKVGAVAGRLFSNAYGESLGDVNEAVKSVGQNMVSLKRTSAAELEDITGKVLDVAQAFDQDLNKVTGAAGQLMRNGLAKNGKEALDIITRGLQGPANKADDLLDTFNEYGTQFRKLGLDGPAALGLINQAVKAGARDSDVAADALKEFSIRAIDGSKLSAQGFKGLGLNAKDMAAQIAKGGPAAEKGLGTVLDRLRAIKDPTKQAQIATALFGTQAEDLGQALFAMDTSKATKELGNVAGAADDMSKKLNDNAQTNITSFVRQVQTKFVDLIGNKILPAVTRVSATIATQFGPAFGTAAAFLGRHEAAATRVAVGIGALAAVIIGANVAMRVGRAVTAAWTAATQVAAAAQWLFAQRTTIMMAATRAWWALQMVIRGATIAWTAAQWLLNAALTANPIGIVVVLLAALVGGLIIAYKRSETFRNIVNAALRGVGAAFAWMWGIAKKVGAWLKDHWRDVVFWIGGPIGIVVLLVTKHWSTIRRVFMAALRWVGSTFKAGWALLRDWVVNPVVRAWNYLSAWAARIRALLRNIIDWVATNFRRGWARIEGWMRGPVDAARTAINRIIDGVKRIFSDGVDRIGQIWDKLKAKTKKPISFLINTVINGGLLKAYNWVADKLSLTKIDPIKIKGFKAGGPTGNGVSDHQVAGVAHANEHYVTADEVRKTPGGHNTWDRLRAMARARLLPGFFLGGRAPVGGAWNRHRSGYGFARWAGDNPGPVGRPVHAWGPGSTAQVNRWNHSYGYHVRLNHPGGVQSLYAHLSAILTRVGEKIRSGEIIGLSGGARSNPRSGNSTGPHLHFELRGGSAGLGKDTGLLSRVIDYAGKFKDKIAGAFGRLKELGNSPWANLVKGAAEKLKEAAIDKVTSANSAQAGSSGFTAAGGGSNRSIGRTMMLQRWGSGQWPSLNSLWTRESGWRTTARNPSSGAYGIPQSLPASKMASAGSDWRSNPRTQIKWGLGYIASRYGSPAAAWRHSQRTGWYGNGTPAAIPGISGVAEHGAELVVNPQLRNFRGGEQVFDAEKTKKMLGGLGAGATVQQTNHFPTVMDPATAAEAAGGRLAAALRANGW